jgi:protein TonB
MEAGECQTAQNEDKIMITRFITATAAGMVMTAFLIFVMNYLIDVSEAVESTPRDPMTLEFLPQLDDTEVQVDEPPPVMPDPPVAPPPLVPPTELSSESELIGIPQPPPAQPVNTHVPPILGTANNPLINIIAVQPNYPAAASQRGLEGHVIVAFDVTEIGTVSNVVVVESSSSVFNKAARDAAYRFRYKARMIDGVPQGSTGLRKLFRFEMEQS